MLRDYLRILVLLTSVLLVHATAYGQGTAFTYQGKLNDGGQTNCLKQDGRESSERCREHYNAFGQRQPRDDRAK